MTDGQDQQEAQRADRSPFVRMLDVSAAGLSGLCLVHCLALPVVALAIPTLALFESPIVHALFLLFALPLSVFALRASNVVGAARLVIRGLVILGLAGLTLGVFEQPNENASELVTVAGSLTLVSAHLWNWRAGRRRHVH